MDITFLIHHISRGGGTASQALELARKMQDMGHNISIITTKPKMSSMELSAYGLDFHYGSKYSLAYYPPLAYVFLLKKLLAQEKMKRSNIIQCFNPVFSGAVCAFLPRTFERSCVLRLGADYLQFYMDKMIKYPSWMREIISSILGITIRNSFRRASAIVANCDYLKELYAKEIGSKPVFTIRNGVDTSIFYPRETTTLRKRLNLDGKKIILYVGRIEWRKGVDRILFALNDVKREYRDFILLLVGSTNISKSFYISIKKMIDNFEICQNVMFTGSVPHNLLPDYYSLAELVVFPSRSTKKYRVTDGLPNIILESMACAKTVLAANVCGVPEVISDGRTGFLYDPNNQKELSEKILSIIADEEERQKMGENARQYILEHHNLTNVVKKYIETYHKVL